MLTSIEYITENFNNQFWELGNNLGNEFEEYIHSILAKELRPYYKDGLRITKTSRTRDDGIDIYIESSVSFVLLGVNFALNGKETIKVVIECKSTSHNKIALDKFARNIIENSDIDLDYFILVTNGTIVPSAFYAAITEFQKSNCCFLLFDQYFLLQFLNQSEYSIEGNACFIQQSSPIQLQYQIRKGRIDGRNCFELYFDIRNYSNQPTNIKLNLISNRNWNIEDSLNEKLVPAHQGICLRFLVKRIYNDGLNDFRLNISYNNQSQLLYIKNPEVVPDFQPPLSGAEHKRIITQIYNELLDLSSPHFYYLYGEAGIGKTRIIDEIIKEIYSTDYIYLHILCKQNNKQTLRNLLCKELKIRNADESLQKILFNYFKSKPFARLLIVIEDLHNASDDFYSELKNMISQMSGIPCACLLAGREDTTVYNESFFSCSSWLKEHTQSFEIVPFDEPDCLRFIKSVIKDIPSMVLEKLANISKGNPFYIVQFIEYLLEINFATLLNRNTVGMTNVNTFSSQKYMPSKIESLIKKRKDWLLQLEDGQKYVDFLQILSLFGITAPSDILEEYWGRENAELVSPLFTKHYLSLDDNGDIKFDHETLYLYYNQQLKHKQMLTYISNLILEHHIGIWNYLSNFTKAKLLFYSKKYKESEKLFQPIINDIINTPNISSNNLSRDYFEYLDEIYFLAKRNKNIELQEKIIQASVYIPMHNMDYGTTKNSIDNALKYIDKYHRNNYQLKNTVLQLRAHAELTAAKLKQAEKYFLELLAEERISPDAFSLESRFDLFDRTASLYTRYNYEILAKKYNELSEGVANELEDSKLITLSIMMKAKICYYSDPQKSLEYMDQARKIMLHDNAYRINCHNNVSIEGSQVLISANKTFDFTDHIKNVKSLLAEAVDKNYSFTIIRCHLMLAALYYLSEKEYNIEQSKQYIEEGINASIRYGCEKLMNYYYNLKAIISIREAYSPEHTLKYFDTMLDYLGKQNLLFLGNLDFCYGNIVSITNYAKFILNYGDEQRLYRFLSKLSYYQSNQTCDFDCSKRKSCHYSCNKNINIFKKNIKKIENKKLILIGDKYEYPLLDPYTGYYVVIH